jgi:hypothetical protein
MLFWFAVSNQYISACISCKAIRITTCKIDAQALPLEKKEMRLNVSCARGIINEAIAVFFGHIKFSLAKYSAT